MSSINIDIMNVDQLKKVINALENLKEDLSEANTKIMEDISNEAVEYLNTQYANSPNRLDPNIDFGSIRVSINKTGNNYEIVASGKDVVYEEFGTGDEGQKHKHSGKSKYSLYDYNTGGTITRVKDIKNPKVRELLSRRGVTSGKFWFYPKMGATKHGKTPELSLEDKRKRAEVLINHADEYNITQGVQAGKEMWNTRNYLRSNKSGIKKSVGKVGKEINDKFINSIT